MASWVVTFTVKVGVSGPYALSDVIAEEVAVNLLETAGWSPLALTEAATATSDEMTQTEVLDTDMHTTTKWLS